MSDNWRVNCRGSSKDYRLRLISPERHELDEAKQDGVRQRKHVAMYQEISKSAEEKLVAMNEAFDAYRATTDSKISSLEVSPAQCIRPHFIDTK